MTAQHPDVISVNGASYAVASVRDRFLFDPAEHGLEPISTRTGLMRGYRCHYVVEGVSLYLDDLSITLETEPPLLFGSTPEVTVTVPAPFKGIFASGIAPKHTKYHAEYSDMHHQLLFDGGILAGDDFINDLYVHSGFAPAWKYRAVRELTFEAGILVQDDDRSREAAAYRERRLAETTRPDGTYSGRALSRSDYWPLSPKDAEAMADALVLHIMAEQNSYIAWQLAQEWAELMVIARRAPRRLAPEQIRIALRHTYDDLYGPRFPQLTPTCSPYTGRKEYLDDVEMGLVRPLIPVGFDGGIDYEEIDPSPPQSGGSRLASSLRDPQLGQEFADFVRWHMEQQRAKVPQEPYTEGFHFAEACYAYSHRDTIPGWLEWLAKHRS